jgi:hypothetical protein
MSHSVNALSELKGLGKILQYELTRGQYVKGKRQLPNFYYPKMPPRANFVSKNSTAFEKLKVREPWLIKEVKGEKG